MRARDKEKVPYRRRKPTELITFSELGLGAEDDPSSFPSPPPGDLVLGEADEARARSREIRTFTMLVGARAGTRFQTPRPTPPTRSVRRVIAGNASATGIII